MDRIEKVIILFVIMVLMTACSKSGDTKKVVFEKSDSDLFTEAEIDSAKDGQLVNENVMSESTTVPVAESYGMKVKTNIEFYTPLMSSVPGMPIEIDTRSNEDTERLQLNITTDAGQLLLWNDAGKIINLKKEYICPFNDVTIYWSPLSEGDDSVVEGAEVIIGIFNKDLGRIVTSYIGSIELDEKGYHRITYEVKLN